MIHGHPAETATGHGLSRQSHSAASRGGGRELVEARKRDDGDANAHHKGALMTHSAEKIEAAVEVVHE
jgi:hypothetical protein